MIGQICCYAAASNVNIMNIVVPPPSRSLLHVNASHIPEPSTRQPSSLSPTPGGRVVKTINLDTRILLSTPGTICPKCSDDLQSTIKNCFQAIIYNANDNKGHQRLHNLLICEDL